MKKKRVTITVDSFELAGEIYFPETTDRAHPALCICHGIPAVPPDPTDRGYVVLAERFCASGFVTLIFNFRGTGQSQGNLDILGWTRDLEAAIDFLADIEKVNRSNICLLGFSGGAAVSVYVASQDPRVSAVVTCACPSEFDFLIDKQQAQAIIDHLRSIGVIRDKAFPPSIEEWLENFSLVSPIRWIDRISPHPTLLIHGDKDEVVSIDHAFRLYAQAKEPKEIAIIPDAEHRLRLEEKAIATAMNWLKAHTLK